MADPIHICLGRGEGKTTALLGWLTDDSTNRMLLTFCAGEAHRLRREYPWLRDRIWPIEVAQHRLREFQGAFALDDLDLVPYRMREELRCRPAIFSTTPNRPPGLTIQSSDAYRLDAASRAAEEEIAAWDEVLAPLRARRQGPTSGATGVHPSA